MQYHNIYRVLEHPVGDIEQHNGEDGEPEEGGGPERGVNHGQHHGNHKQYHLNHQRDHDALC